MTALLIMAGGLCIVSPLVAFLVAAALGEGGRRAGDTPSSPPSPMRGCAPLPTHSSSVPQ